MKCLFTLLLLAKSLQLCPTLCDPIDSSPPNSAVPGILQARTLEWISIAFSNAWRWKVKVKSLSHVWLFATPWTAAYQAPLSMGFSRQQYWSRGAIAFSLFTLLTHKPVKFLIWFGLYPLSGIVSFLVSSNRKHSLNFIF